MKLEWAWVWFVFLFNITFYFTSTGEYSQFKHVLAMGDEFDPKSINAYQMADFAETCGLNKKLLSRQLCNLADKVIAILTQQSFIENITQEPYFTEEDRSYMAEVQAHILERTQHLRSQAPDIPNIEV